MAKQHPKDPAHWRIKRSRNGSEHIDNCKSGYYRDTNRYKQIHHVLTISSLQDSYIFDQLKDMDNFYIVRNCLMVTKWNINDKDNCIGLPLKPAFVGRNPKKWGGYPCHQVDHDLYTDRINVSLKQNVWDIALGKAEDCEVKYNDIAAELRAASSSWRAFLIQRGSTESGGTAFCWRKRYEEAMSDTWYRPFSMSPGLIRPRRPSPSPEDLSSNFSGAIKELFAKL